MSRIYHVFVDEVHSTAVVEEDETFVRVVVKPPCFTEARIRKRTMDRFGFFFSELRALNDAIEHGEARLLKARAEVVEQEDLLEELKKKRRRVQ